MSEVTDTFVPFQPSEKGVFEPHPIAGVHIYTPVIHPDDRGSFHEWFKAELCIDAVGYPFFTEQANLSVSAAGVIRGIHLADVPPGQAKVVTCPAGRVTDIFVDLRRDSPTFGRYGTVELNSDTRRVVFLSVGIGHAFISHEDNSVVTYLTSMAYNPEGEYGVNIADPALGIDLQGMLGSTEAVLSEKDRMAPGLEDIMERLPRIADCDEWEDSMRDGWVLANEGTGVDDTSDR